MHKILIDEIMNNLHQIQGMNLTNEFSSYLYSVKQNTKSFMENHKFDKPIEDSKDIYRCNYCGASQKLIDNEVNEKHCYICNSKNWSK